MANTLITPQIITREAVAQLQNAVIMGAKVNRQHENEFKKIGDTVNIRQPVRVLSTGGPDITSYLAANSHDIEEASQSFQLDTHRTVPLRFEAKDLVLTVEDFSNRYIKPAAIRLAADIENSIAALYTKIYNFTGTVGTVPSTLLSIGAADVLLTNSGLHEGMDRLAFYEPNAALNLANALSSVQPNDIARRAIEKAMINMYAGFDVFRSVHSPTHTFGINDGAGAVDDITAGGSQEVTYAASKATWTQSLVVDTFTTTDTFKAGDIITIAGVNAWNNQTQASTGALQNFVVTADATLSGGAGTLTISPPMIITGPYQTVDAVAGDNAIITCKAFAGEQAKQNLLFAPEAITYASANYKAPKGLNAETVSDNGFSITYSWDGDIATHRETHRLDVLYGVKLQRPQFACRHTS